MSAHPKIQRMCEEESEDHEAVAKLLEINDSIHRTIERYRLIKKGDVDGANKIPKGTLGTSGAGVKKGPDNELSLIDFGGPEDEMPAAPSSSAPATSASAAQSNNSLENDLLGLSMGDTPFGQGGGISLGLSDGPSLISQSQPPPPQIPTIQQSPPTQPQANIPKPNYDPFGSIAGSTPSPAPPGAMSSVFGQQTQQQQHAQQQNRDPFAALASSTPRGGSPFQFQQSVNRTASPAAGSGSATLFDLGAPTSSQPTTPKPPMSANQSRLSTGAAAPDDEWTFTSALPDQPHDLTVSNSAVNITWTVSRPPEDESVVLIKSRISNNTAQPISDFTFQVAVTKVSNLLFSKACNRH